MSELLTNWAVAPAANLTGVARLRHAPGEPATVDCKAKVLVYVVLDGAYTARSGDASIELAPGDVYFLRLPDASDAEAGVPVAGATSSSILVSGFSASTTALHTAVAALPPSLRLTASVAEARTVVGLLAHEFDDIVCGKELLSGHLFEALFLYIVRHWYGRFPDASCAINAFGDPNLSRAIERIHRAPEHRWTVDQLAELAGQSRAAFARHFKLSVGETPLGYVTRWRMNLAAQLLDDGHDIRSVCHQVGYDSEFAFSRAFSRHHGTPPSHYRTRTRLAA
jgi:AraC-like DNA-binding protein